MVVPSSRDNENEKQQYERARRVAGLMRRVTVMAVPTLRVHARFSRAILESDSLQDLFGRSRPGLNVLPALFMGSKASFEMDPSPPHCRTGRQTASTVQLA
jgi:hypothetical protein